jgi:hypothetical protein
MSRVRWAGHVARIEGKRNSHRFLVLTPKGRDSIKLVDNIKKILGK